MTQDEIIEMAKQSDLGFLFNENWLMHEEIERFANLVAQHERERLTDAAMKAAEKAVDVAIALEREACAKLCESEGIRIDASYLTCAEFIRARGQA